MNAATATAIPGLLSEAEVRSTRRVLALLDSDAFALNDDSGIVSRIYGELAGILREHVVPLAPAEAWAATHEV